MYFSRERSNFFPIVEKIIDQSLIEMIPFGFKEILCKREEKEGYLFMQEVRIRRRNFNEEILCTIILLILKGECISKILIVRKLNDGEAEDYK